MYIIYMTLPMNMFWLGRGDIKDKLIKGYQYIGGSMDSMEHLYLYGTQVNLRSDRRVLIKNSMIPTGTVLYRWDYIFSYNTGRIPSQLPTMLPNNKYQIKLNVESYSSCEYWIRIISFDYSGELISIDNIYKDNPIFMCDENMFNYSIELLVNGIVNISFSSLDIINLTSLNEDFNILSDSQILNLKSNQEKRVHRNLTIMNKLLF
ncbi:accessory Sec system protein Asp3 [Pediococcus pentosaceus]|uniref:accessory Sec system protein Asp3 n=1 Tax=Pediococcus pentosaceus TaxID=1255 RepID=UPI0010500704|nr:accessory Sec system protein Asp3 [Pediococcus pentosaceus]KAF0521392.1 accessory Sec system protein Asp3 [Pediococcus pentosaceus]